MAAGTRRLAVAAAALTLVGLVGAPARGAPNQIEDAAGDHPVPFMDLVGVGLALTEHRRQPALEVRFDLAGPITPENRAVMTGYSFTAKVGSCDLLVRFVGYPDGAFDDAGFVTGRCGAGRDVGGVYRFTETGVAVVVGLGDLKGVTVGATMTDLAAYTSPGEGMYHDDTTAPSAAGDAASSDKPWTIG